MSKVIHVSRLLVLLVSLCSLLACSGTRFDKKDSSPAPKVGGESYDGLTFARSTDTACADGSNLLSTIRLKDSVYSLARENCVDLNPEVPLAASEVEHTIGESTLVYAGEVFNQLTFSESNPVSCIGNPARNQAAGEFACLGVHDYGHAYGGDADLCSEPNLNPYSNPGIGCVVSTPVCASGSALATSTLEIRMATPSDLVTLANRLNSSPSLVLAGMVRIWTYTCQ